MTLVSLPIENYYDGIFPFLTANQVYRFGQVSKDARDIVQEAATKPYEDITSEGIFTITRPISVTAFFHLKVRMDNISILQKLGLRTVALVSQAATVDLLDNAQTSAFLNTVGEIQLSVSRKLKEIMEEETKMRGGKQFLSAFLTGSETLKRDSLGRANQELCSLQGTLKNLSFNLTKSEIVIKSGRHETKFTTLEVPNGIAKVRDIKIASAKALGLGIRHDLVKILICGELYNDNTSILALPNPSDIRPVVLIKKQ
jgi:hypothetical protein